MTQVTVRDVTALAPDTCSVIGSTLVFSNFGVNSTIAPPPTIGIGAPSDGTGVVGVDTNLDFQVSGSEGLDDTFVSYQATGAVLGLDMEFQATPLTGLGSATITELACSSAFVSNACLGTTYADFSATSICVSATCTYASNAALLAGGAQSPVFIQNDIALSNADVPQFVNSHFASLGAAVPEPALAPLAAGALLGLGLLRHFRRKPSMHNG